MCAKELSRTLLLGMGIFIVVITIFSGTSTLAQSSPAGGKSSIPAAGSSCPPKGSPSSSGSPPLGYVIPHLAPPYDVVIKRPAPVQPLGGQSEPFPEWAKKELEDSQKKARDQAKPLQGESEPFPEWARKEMEEQARKEQLEKQRGRRDVSDQYPGSESDSGGKKQPNPIDWVVQQINQWNQGGNK